ncbi:MAG: YfiR family protein [Pseudomonadota bacterium]
MRVARFSLQVLFLTVLSASPLQASGDAETSVKAAIVHKISKFVAWPPDAFESDSEAMQFCVAGDEHMLSAMTALAAERIHGRRVEAVSVQSPAEAAVGCDVLVFGDNALGEAASWASAVADRPVLTFGVAGGYGADDSIVRVMIRRNKVRFEINLDANESTGLRIGGQLLQLAAAVGGRGG